MLKSQRALNSCDSQVVENLEAGENMQVGAGGMGGGGLRVGGRGLVMILALEDLATGEILQVHEGYACGGGPWGPVQMFESQLFMSQIVQDVQLSTFVTGMCRRIFLQGRPCKCWGMHFC